MKLHHRAVRLVVALVVVAGGLVWTANSASAAPGDSAADPIDISTCSGLLSIDDTTAALGKHYRLSADIDCTGTTMAPLANGSTYFSASFNGNGKAIAGLVINCAASDCGLFKQVTASADIHDVTFTSPQVIGGTSYLAVGIVAGRAASGATDGSSFRNITLTSPTVTGQNYVGGVFGLSSLNVEPVTMSYITVTGASITASGSTATTNGTHVGGLAGSCESCSISDSSVGGTITGRRSIGGLVGSGGSTSTNGKLAAINSSSSATVNATAAASGSQTAGGLFGSVNNSASSSGAQRTIRNTSFSGSLVADQIHVGGIVGRISNGFIDASRSTGNVTGLSYVAGLVGLAEGTSITESRTEGTISSTGDRSNGYCDNRSGGLVGSLEGASSVSESFSTATVRGCAWFGGLIGQISNSTLTDSYFFGDIAQTGASSGVGTSARASIGGLVGLRVAAPISITRAYSVIESVTYEATTGQVVKTIIGEEVASVAVTCTDIHWDKDISSLSTNGTTCGTGRATSDMKTQATFANFNFSTVWSIAAGTNSGYPTLQAFNTDSTPPTASWTAPSSPSTSRTLSYTLNFSESVSGIAAGDFSNTGTATGCTFTPSATSGTSVTVSVTCTSDGTVVARLAANSVADAAANNGPTANADATSVTIDSTAPALTFARSAATATSASITFTVTGDEAITCSTISTTDGTDFDFVNISAISVAQTSATVCTITATSTATSGGGTVNSELQRATSFSVTDTAGNAATTLTPTSQSIAVTIASSGGGGGGGGGPAPTTTTSTTTTTTASTTSTTTTTVAVTTSVATTTTIRTTTTTAASTTTTTAAPPATSSTTTVPATTTTASPISEQVIVPDVATPTTTIPFIEVEPGDVIEILPDTPEIVISAASISRLARNAGVTTGVVEARTVTVDRAEASAWARAVLERLSDLRVDVVPNAAALEVRVVPPDGAEISLEFAIVAKGSGFPWLNLLVAFALGAGAATWFIVLRRRRRGDSTETAKTP